MGERKEGGGRKQYVAFTVGLGGLLKGKKGGRGRGVDEGKGGSSKA